MTTPGGVPNLPQGALTIETLAPDLQDMTVGAMRSRASARIPAMFNSSTGGDVSNDNTPFGILTHLYSGFASHVANANPADIKGPNDLPQLLTDFINELPVVAQLVGLINAIAGTYTGDDAVLLAIQEVFEPIRMLLALVSGKPVEDFPPTAAEVAAGWNALANALDNFVSDLYEKLTGQVNGTVDNLARFLTTYLFGPISGNRLPLIPISHIGEINPNLLAGYSFDSADTISGGEDVWTWDGAVGHTGPGSVTIHADAATHELLSIDIATSQGHQFTISGWAKWTGLVGIVGAPVQLALTGFGPSGAAVDQVVVASHSTIPPTTDWLQLTGPVYITPVGVTSIRVRLVVGANATAGQVWFDDISCVKDHNTLFQRLVGGSSGPGSTLTDDIGNLFNASVTNALNLLTKAPKDAFDGLVQTIEGDVQAGFEDVGARLDAFLHGGSILDGSKIGLGSIADTFVPGLGTVHDNLVTRLLRVGGTGYTSSDSATALESMVHALVDVASRSSRLETVFTGGVSEGDDFERTSTSNLGAGWLLSYTTGASGIWATPDGHSASWIPAGLANREFLAIRNTGNVRSTTDLQEVAMVLSSVAPNFFGACGYNSLWVRISDATTGIADVTGIKIEFGGDGSVQIVRYLNGAPTVLNALPANSIVPPGPGARIAGLAGEPGTARVFRALIGTSRRLEIPEVGTASGLGAAYRRWGHGGRATATIIGQRGPGSSHQWTGKDQLTS